jgi:OmpA-OmpF porin, OOP family
MSLRKIALAATILSAPGLAAAQSLTGTASDVAAGMTQKASLTGLYIGAGGGLNWLQNEHLIGANGTAARASIQSRVGGVAVLSLGYALPNGIRLEVEGDYRNNSFSHAHDFGFAAGVGGKEIKYGAMFNVLYDVTNLLALPFNPYVGVGVGYQWAHLSKFHAQGTATGFPSLTSDDRRGAIAYQFILGGAAPIAPVPGLAVTAEYRFLGLGSRNYDVGAIAAPGVPPTFGRVKLGNDFNHAVLVGLRYNFGQTQPPPPPAPVAAPAPAPARSYLVFFDWDKATLTDRARQIIKEAAENSTRVQYTRIEVNGYTDTSGTPRYNQGLSVRRATAVQAELVKDGVPQNAITIQGFGDTHLLVPTGPGVREPQNRRVEIIIR